MQTRLIRTRRSRCNRAPVTPRSRRAIPVEDTPAENSAAKQLSETMKQGRSECSGLAYFTDGKFALCLNLWEIMTVGKRRDADALTLVRGIHGNGGAGVVG
jgi:hypothetical protein